MVALILYLMVILFILLFLIFMSVYTLFLIYSSIKGSPYVPTKNRILDEILEPAKIKKGSYFIELGSGDGRMLRHVVKKYEVRGLGVDVNPLLVVWSRFLAKLSKIDTAEFKVENIFDTEYRNADCLYIFLMPELIDKLTPKLVKELKKGTVVISHGFPVKAWKSKLYFTLKRTPFPTYYYRIK